MDKNRDKAFLAGTEAVPFRPLRQKTNESADVISLEELPRTLEAQEGVQGTAHFGAVPVPTHAGNRHSMVFAEFPVEHTTPSRNIKGLARASYYATGTLWTFIGYAGLAIAALDNTTAHVFDFLLLGLPDALGIIGAFSWYHGRKQLQAAREGSTDRDLSLRGTFHDIKGHAHAWVRQALEYAGLKKKKDLRWWLAGQ